MTCASAPVVQILLSLPGIGPVIAATMLAEASQPLRERDYQALRNYTGAAPVTKRSGKKKVIVMRYACNEQLRNALYHWSRTSMQKDPRASQGCEPSADTRGSDHCAVPKTRTPRAKFSGRR